MTQRLHFKITDAEVAMLQQESKPRLLSLADQRSAQDRVNEIWEVIAHRLGVDVDSIGPDQGGGNSITAVKQVCYPGCPMLPSVFDHPQGKANAKVNLARRLGHPLWMHCQEEVILANQLVDKVPVRT